MLCHMAGHVNVKLVISSDVVNRLSGCPDALVFFFAKCFNYTISSVLPISSGEASDYFLHNYPKLR